jgi:glycosyltransferase involved in cell wall biosynthesis
VRVIPYGIAAAKSLPMRPGDGALRILYTGRLESTQKRVADLIDVASGLDKRGTLFRMTIVGDGPERASLAREISARDLSRSVTLLEPVSNERILEMCRDHDAFILPSAYEGMPLGLLEAMGQGCIPVATDIESGVPELIRRGENGFIVGVGNIDEFVARLDDIAKSSSLRATMSENAWRTVAESRFASRAMIESYMSIFESVSREIAERAFRRSGRMRPVSLSLRDRIAAPLWYLRPSMRAQQKIAQ